MSQYTELTVYRDVYALVLMLFQYTKEFPREYKYSLGQDIKRDSIQLVRSIYPVVPCFNNPVPLDVIDELVKKITDFRKAYFTGSLKPLINAEFKLADLKAGFDYVDKDDTAIKVVFRP